MVVLFMVLKEDNINQSMLVPMDLRNLIPEDHPCYFIKNVVDLIDCSRANKEFRGKPGEFAYPRELLLRLILMSVFDGGLYGNPSKIRMQRKMETEWAQKIYKKRSKTVELPFAHIKQNMKLHEFITTGIKNTNTEFKLYTIGHNLKRIYNEIKLKNNEINN